MANKHRVTRACHRNSVKNKGNAKQGLKRKNKRTKPKSKYPKPTFTYPGTTTIIDWSAPWDKNVEACIARVESGQKCYCLERCKCRTCKGCRNSHIPGDLDECAPACKTCPKHVPCR